MAALFSPEHGFAGRRRPPGLRGCDGRRHRPAGLQPLRRDAAAHARDAARHRRAGLRHPGRRRALLHLRATMVYALEAAAKAAFRSMCWTGPIRSPACTWKGRARRRNQSFVGYFAGCRSPRHDHGRAGAAVQRRKQDRRGAHRDSRWRTGSAATGSTPPAPVDRTLAQYAQPERRACSIRACACWSLQGTLGGARNGCALRADRRGFHRRPRTGGVSEPPRIPGVRVYPTSFTPAESISRAWHRGRALRDRQPRAVRFHAPGPGSGGGVPEALSGQDRFRGRQAADRQRRRRSGACRPAKTRAPSSRAFRMPWRRSSSCANRICFTAELSSGRIDLAGDGQALQSLSPPRSPRCGRWRANRSASSVAPTPECVRSCPFVCDGRVRSLRVSSRVPADYVNTQRR